MLSKQLSLGQLEHLLQQTGFQRIPTRGGHRFFRHPASGVELLLPGGDADQPVSAADLIGAKTMLVENELVTAEEWQQWLATTEETLPDAQQRRYSVG